MEKTTETDWERIAELQALIYADPENCEDGYDVLTQNDNN